MCDIRFLNCRAFLSPQAVAMSHRLAALILEAGGVSELVRGIATLAHVKGVESAKGGAGGRGTVKKATGAGGAKNITEEVQVCVCVCLWSGFVTRVQCTCSCSLGTRPFSFFVAAIDQPPEGLVRCPSISSLPRLLQ